MPIVASLLKAIGFDSFNRREIVVGSTEPSLPELINKIPLSQIDSVIPQASIPLDKVILGKLYVEQLISSNNYVAGASGWMIDGDGNCEFNSGTFRGVLEAGSIHIPNVDSTADSFHTNASGDSWWGCTQTNWDSNPINAKAYIKKNGDASFNNVNVSGTLKTTVFQKDVVSAIGGQLIVANSDVIDIDMTALDTCKLTIKGDTLFVLNSVLLMKDGTNEEYLRVTNVASAPEYTVTRDINSAYGADLNPAWERGSAVVQLGISDGSSAYSGGWLRLYGAGANAPYYSVFSRNGLDYDDYNEACRLGNLNGIGGKTSECYGLFLGDYVAKKYLIYDNISNDFELAGNIKPIIYKKAKRDLKAGRAVKGALNGSGYLWYANDFNDTTVQSFLGVTLTDIAKNTYGPVQILGEAPISGISAGAVYYPYTHVGASMDWDNASLAITSGHKIAQTFLTGSSTDEFCIVDAVSLKFTIGSKANGTLKIYNTSGGVPTNQIGLSDYDTYIYPVTGETIFVFETPVQLSLNTTYAIVFEPLSVIGTNYIKYRNLSYYTDGNMLINTGAGWTNYATYDLFFKLRYSRGLVSYLPGITTFKIGVGSSSGKLLIKG